MIREDIEKLIAVAPTIQLGEEVVKTGVNLHGAKLDGLDLSGLDLSKSTLHGASCRGTKFVKCNLQGSIFHGADLKGAIFSGAQLQRANLHGACCCGALFHNARFDATNLSAVCALDAEGLDVSAEKCAVDKIDKVAAGGRFSYSEGVLTVYGDDLRTCTTADMAPDKHYTSADRQRINERAAARHEGNEQFEAHRKRKAAEQAVLAKRMSIDEHKRILAALKKRPERTQDEKDDKARRIAVIEERLTMLGDKP